MKVALTGEAPQVRVAEVLSRSRNPGQFRRDVVRLEDGKVALWVRPLGSLSHRYYVRMQRALEQTLPPAFARPIGGTGNASAGIILDVGSPCSLADALRASLHAAWPLSAEADAALMLELASTVRALHEAGEHSACLGLSLRNVYVQDDGSLKWVGAGYHALRHDDDGVGRLFVAPEGDSLSSDHAQAADVACLAGLLQAWADTGLRRHGGVARPWDELKRRLDDISSASPLARPSARRVHAIVALQVHAAGLRPNWEALSSWLLAARAAHEQAKREPMVLRVSRDGSVVVLPNGEQIGLARRAALRRIVVTLADERIRCGSSSVSTAALVAAGWPGEEILHDAAMKRLYVAIYSLRKQGLESLIENDKDGYRFSPVVAVRWA